jgi:hypothetical protein
MQTFQPLSPSCDDMEVESECTIFTLACLETVPTDPDAITCNFIVSSDELLWLNLLHVDSTTSCVLTNICQAVGTKGLLMSITSHHGPHHPNNPEWIGSSYNLSIVWENGETLLITSELQFLLDPTACNQYAQHLNCFFGYQPISTYMFGALPVLHYRLVWKTIAPWKMDIVRICSVDLWDEHSYWMTEVIRILCYMF